MKNAQDKTKERREKAKLVRRKYPALFRGLDLNNRAGLKDFNAILDGTLPPEQLAQRLRAVKETMKIKAPSDAQLQLNALIRAAIRTLESLQQTPDPLVAADAAVLCDQIYSQLRGDTP